MKPGSRRFRGHDILARRTDRSVVTRRRCARMGILRSPCPKETKDDHSSKIIVRRCGIGFCRVRGDRAGAGPDHAGMQCEISGRQDRRHAQRPEVERFPQGPMRRRRRRGARRCARRRTRCRSAAPAAPKRSQEGSRTRRRAGAADRACGIPVRGRSEIRQGNRRQGAGCTPASISTTPTRPPTAMAA